LLWCGGYPSEQQCSAGSLKGLQMILSHPGKLLLSHGSLRLFFTVAVLTAKIRTYEEHLQRHPKVTISDLSPHV